MVQEFTRGDKLTISVILGYHGMKTRNDLAIAIKDVAKRISNEQSSGLIEDALGHQCGSFSLQLQSVEDVVEDKT